MLTKVTASHLPLTLLLTSTPGSGSFYSACHHLLKCQSTSSYIPRQTCPISCHQSRTEHTYLLSNKTNMEYTPAPIGVEVRGVDLKDRSLPKDCIEQIKKDVHRHRLLIFKDQGVVSADRHVEISQWFGELESTFYKHPKSPHPDVFRVSNVDEEGCRNVGRTGWHIDGSFMEKPFSFAIYHMVSVPKIGNTAFVPLKELVESLTEDTRAKWEQLWYVDHNWQVIHPLVYPHPVTKDPTICFHLGMTGAFVWDYGTDSERQTDWRETSQILKEIYQEITKDSNRLVYSHKWEVGDFIISDNLAVGHEATPETQLPLSEVGLRVLHRTTIKGKWTPQKEAQHEG